ncbi:MAG: CPBP family intramembrane metalloprotease [Chitinophagaceae bacterium]|nr:CPBP family intramembrane metalloprotease [Chitinophagaceae bacterium]
MDKFPNWADHIVAFIFCILIPLLAVKQNLKNNPAARYTSTQKRAFYLSTCFSLFIMAAIILSVWLLCKRPLAEMGLSLTIKGRAWIWPLLAFVIVYAIDTISSVATPKKIAAAVGDWEKRTPFMPANSKELRVYLLMCLCAGVFEEVVYRGYMVTYFSYLFKDSAYRESLSVFLPALIFSISHFYHGLKNIIKIFVLSVFFGYIYIQSGSLVIVMLLHFLVNVLGGLLSVKYLKNEKE